MITKGTLRSGRIGFISGFVLRFAGFVLLLAALWLAVLDAARSIAAGAWIQTPLGSDWAAVWPAGPARFESWARTALPTLQERLLAPVLDCPGWAVLGVAAVLLATAGHRTDSGEIRDAGRPAG